MMKRIDPLVQRAATEKGLVSTVCEACGGRGALGYVDGSAGATAVPCQCKGAGRYWRPPGPPGVIGPVYTDEDLLAA